MRRHHRPLILAVALFAAAAVPIAALARSFGKSRVTATFTGAVKARHKVGGLDRCLVVNGLDGNSKTATIRLYLGSGKPLSRSFENPSLVVTMILTGAPIVSASLATPGAAIDVVVGNSQWQWPDGGSSAGGTGSGTVSLTNASGSSGSLDADLPASSGSGRMVDVTATWQCAKASIMTLSGSS
jgi:hypothetical protein